MKETTKTNQTEPNTSLLVVSERKPFDEPVVSPASDVLEVTKNFLFMMLGSQTGNKEDDNF